MERGLKAVILVAGRGERLRPLTSQVPKSLLPIGGVPILGRMLTALATAGVGSVVLVTGYRAAQIQRYVREEFPQMRAQFRRNPVYASTNTLYSLMLARGAVEGRAFLLLDGDLVFESEVLRTLMARERENLLACDGSARLDTEAVRAIGGPNRQILHVGKNLSARGVSFGESIGMAKMSKAGSRRLFPIGERVLRNHGRRHYYEAAFQALIEEGVAFRAVDIRTYKWTEIDTKADLRRAWALFSGSAKRGG